MTIALKYLAVALFLVCLPEDKPTWETGNAFAIEYKHWAELRNVRVQSPGTLSAPEMLAWQSVKSHWRQLEKQVDAEYQPR